MLLGRGLQGCREARESQSELSSCCMGIKDVGTRTPSQHVTSPYCFCKMNRAGDVQSWQGILPEGQDLVRRRLPLRALSIECSICCGTTSFSQHPFGSKRPLFGHEPSALFRQVVAWLSTSCTQQERGCVLLVHPSVQRIEANRRLSASHRSACELLLRQVYALFGAPNRQ